MLKLLKSKIFLRQFFVFSILIFATFSVISLAVLSVTKVSIKNQQLDTVENYRVEVSNQINRWLEGRQISIKSHTTYIEALMHHDISSKMFTEILKSQVKSDINLIDIIILDDKGKIVNSTGGPSNTNLSNRAYYTEAMKGKSSITSFYKSAKGDKIIMAIGEPIYVDGKPAYVVAGVISIKRISDVVQSVKFKDWGEAYLIDPNGMLITGSDLENDYKSNTNNKLESFSIKKVLSGEKGTGSYIDFNGQKVYGSYEWMDMLKIGLIVEFAEDKVNQPIYRLEFFIRVFGLVVFIVGLFLAFVISKRIVDPINLLIGAAQRISESNYQEPIDMKAGNELDLLIDDFNCMQSTIKYREEELSKKNMELKVKRTEAEKANRLKSQFLANMSHELRTPLNAIIGFTTRVIKKSGNTLPMMQQENLNIVKGEAQHLLKLINDLLDYSKMDVGKMEVYNEVFDLTEVLKEVNNIADTLGEGKSFTYKHNICLEQGIKIFSDKAKIKQILINLVGNAFKFSDKGYITLSAEHKGNLYIIKVEDQGIGIAPEDLEDIFYEFSQIDGSNTKNAGGTGLGLTITKGFVELLGGNIEVESEIGKGSCFTVYLPDNLAII